jgi:uncharacterized protein (DUF2342 family)
MVVEVAAIAPRLELVCSGPQHAADPICVPAEIGYADRVVSEEFDCSLVTIHVHDTWEPERRRVVQKAAWIQKTVAETLRDMGLSAPTD